MKTKTTLNSNKLVLHTIETQNLYELQRSVFLKKRANFRRK